MVGVFLLADGRERLEKILHLAELFVSNLNYSGLTVEHSDYWTSTIEKYVLLLPTNCGYIDVV